MPTALDVVDGEVRELIRRRGLDPFTDPAHVRVLVRDVGIPHHLRVTAGTPEETSAFLRAMADLPDSHRQHARDADPQAQEARA